jgi:hypothetical protein
VVEPGSTTQTGRGCPLDGKAPKILDWIAAHNRREPRCYKCVRCVMRSDLPLVTIRTCEFLNQVGRLGLGQIVRDLAACLPACWSLSMSQPWQAGR